MQIKFGIVAVPGREFTANVNTRDLANCATIGAARQIIAAAIEDEAKRIVAWYTTALGTEQVAALLEAAKAAQEAENGWK